jgi:hypothetical protein
MKVFLILFTFQIANLQVTHLNPLVDDISNYTQVLQFENKQEITTKVFSHSTTGILNEPQSIFLNITNINMTNIDLLNNNLEDSSTPLTSAQDGDSPCYLKLNTQSSFDHVDANMTMGKKNIQVNDYNIQLAGGTVYFVKYNNLQMTFINKINTYVSFKGQYEDVFDMILLRVYDTENILTYYLLTYTLNYVHIYGISINRDEIKVNVHATLSRVEITERLIAMNYTISFSNIINFYHFDYQGVTQTRLFFKENAAAIGFIDITATVDSLLNLDVIKTLDYKDSKIKLNILDSFLYVKQIKGDFPITAYIYLAVRGVGMIVLQDAEIKNIFSHPYITGIDSITYIKPNTPFYIGLYVSYFSINEFFIELILNSADPINFKVNKIYTYNKSFRGHVSDYQSAVTYFVNSTNIIQIRRDIPYDIPVQYMNYNHLDTNYYRFYVISSQEGQGYISMISDDGISKLVKPKFNERRPQVVCNFTKIGNYTVRASEYNLRDSVLVQTINEYNVIVEEPSEVRWFHYFIIVFGTFLFLLIGLYIYRMLKLKRNRIEEIEIRLDNK